LNRLITLAHQSPEWGLNRSISSREKKKNAVLPRPTGWTAFQCGDSLEHKDTS